jgi:hypothetical protein
MLENYIYAHKTVVPAVRAKLAKKLVSDMHMSEDEAAKRIGVTQAAVSKYLSGKYSQHIKEVEAKIDSEIIDRRAQGIAAGSSGEAEACVCETCRSIKPFGCRVYSSLL